MKNSTLKILLTPTLIVLAVAIVMIAWNRMDTPATPDGFIVSNGRIEATEINISTKLAGRVEEILVDEGDFVTAGQALVRMQTDSLQAQRAEAIAILQQSKQMVASAHSKVAMLLSDLAAAKAVIVQRESELNYSKRRLARYEKAVEQQAVSAQEIDEERTRLLVMEAVLNAAHAQATAVEASIEAAQAEIIGAEYTVIAREATVNRIEADIDDCVLVSPRDGRTQYRIAQPGEVLNAGGRALNVVDLSDVYMTFFLPEAVAGRVALGTEVRLILDAVPEYVVPAEVSFIASTAQFTPKAVETAMEREKLMFRVRARITPELLKKHLQQVKTGLPGVAWIRLDSSYQWPESLSVRVPE